MDTVEASLGDRLTTTGGGSVVCLKIGSVGPGKSRRLVLVLLCRLRLGSLLLSSWDVFFLVISPDHCQHEEGDVTA